jgi:pyruvate dehydrogenase E2 component (dihydrolipoamide acetyltransferase)
LEPGEELPVTGKPEVALAGAPPKTAEAPEAPKAQTEVSLVAPASGVSGKVRVTPAARRLAREMNIDLAQVVGRGPGGCVHEVDVYAFAEQQRTAATLLPVAPTSLPRVSLPKACQSRIVALTGPRKIIAERMSYSASTAPHLTVSLRVDMTEATRLQSCVTERIQQRTGHRLSSTAIIARAVASILPQHPYINASLNGEEIILWEDIHLGIATSLEDYLIVPVIREAQNKNLEQIVTALADLVERARAKRLTPAEMSGSTFTISNLGMFGVESFTAIINPPESAILAVGQIVDTPRGIDGQIVLRPMMQLTLAADHRIMDGVAAARFLSELKTTLENPYLLV